MSDWETKLYPRPKTFLSEQELMDVVRKQVVHKSKPKACEYLLELKSLIDGELDALDAEMQEEATDAAMDGGDQ